MQDQEFYTTAHHAIKECITIMEGLQICVDNNTEHIFVVKQIQQCLHFNLGKCLHKMPTEIIKPNTSLQSFKDKLNKLNDTKVATLDALNIAIKEKKNIDKKYTNIDTDESKLQIKLANANIIKLQNILQSIHLQDVTHL